MLRTISFIALWIVLTLVLAWGWWELAMFHGAPASPGFVARALGADGEGAYDAMFLEMLIISAVVTGALALVVRHFKSGQKA